MLFFKKNNADTAALRSIIEDHQRSIASLGARLHTIESSCDKLSHDIRENTEAILEVESESDARVTRAINSIQEDFGVMAERERDYYKAYEIDLLKRVDDVSKMQKLIMTWIIVLCATSIFSFLLYFGIM